MLLSAFTATMRIEESNRLAASATTQHIPLNSTTRDFRIQVLYSIHALESYMLFGIDPVSSASFRHTRQQNLARADTSMTKLKEFASRYSLGYDATRINDLDNGFSNLKSLEDKVEQLNESKTAQGTALAYDTFQNQILPLEKSLFSMASDLGQSQMTQADDEVMQLQHANSATLYTLWIATILGALIGGVVSLMLARRITKSIDLVAERADAISEGDLTGKELDHLYGKDQIGTLAAAMQKMQNSLGSIIGTVVDTAGSLTGSAASMRTASDQIHRRIDQQSQQTQQAATAMQDVGLHRRGLTSHSIRRGDRPQRCANGPRRRRNRQACSRLDALHRHCSQ